MMISGKTDIGRVRSENQDTWRAGCRQDGSLWAVVCDGMGGENAGRLASTTAVESMQEQLQEPDPLEEINAGQRLRETVKQSNRVVYQTACEGGSDTYRMGTTIVAVLVRGGDAYYVHVGDSRIYLCRDHALVQLTRDHSRVQDMLDDGRITAQQARYHPERNRLTRALGVEPRVKVDLGTIPVQPGDEILLCSDGLSNQVTSRQITSVLSETPFYSQANELVQLALATGGPDNITAVVLRVTEEEMNG